MAKTKKPNLSRLLKAIRKQLVKDMPDVVFGKIIDNSIAFTLNGEPHTLTINVRPPAKPTNEELNGGWKQGWANTDSMK